MTEGYVGRFAPSPSGPLHAGSAAVALASFLDARAAGGRWLVRIEDIDTPRVQAGADQLILQQLQALGMHWDGEVWYQSKRLAAYQRTFEALKTSDKTYPCCCTRREIADSVLLQHGQFPDGERPYLGTCRMGLVPGRSAKSWRFKVDEGNVEFVDRWLGPQSQNVCQQIGDFIIRRADGLWAYQLCVVVDDQAQNVTHIVRGEDLLSSTGRQFLLGDTLGFARPAMMHIPLVTDERGLKLSKQNGAPALDVGRPLEVLLAAWRHLGFSTMAVNTLEQFWEQAISTWAARFTMDRLAP